MIRAAVAALAFLAMTPAPRPAPGVAAGNPGDPGSPRDLVNAPRARSTFSRPDSLKDVKHVEYLLYRDYYLHANTGPWRPIDIPGFHIGRGPITSIPSIALGSVPLVLPGLDAPRKKANGNGAPAGMSTSHAPPPGCYADKGDICDGGDPDKGVCEAGTYCHSNPNHFLDVVTEAAARHPESGYLMGEAVYALVKYLQPIRAMRLIQKCRAAKWWCDALHGYAFQKMGLVVDAGSFLRRAMDEAPDSVSCAYTDVTWVLGRWDARRAPWAPPAAHTDAATWDCARRRAVSDTIWWLADPLYSVPGNDRWDENVVRSLTARFEREIDETRPDDFDHVVTRPVRWAAEVRRGPWDSYTPFMAVYTGERAARYHFVPDVEPDDLSSPVWHLDAHLDQEGYTPPGRPFSVIPAQVARFRRADSLRIAVATTLRDAPVEPDPDSASWLVFTDGPGSFPLMLKGSVHDGRSVFIGEVAPRRYVLGLEVHGDSTIGWHRQTVAPLPTSGPGLSDLLLYRPTGPTEPDSLLEAAGLMLGSTTVDRHEGLGVYWETYGLPADTAEAHVSFTVTLVSRGGGIAAALGHLVPGGGKERGLVAWTEPGTPGTHRRAVTLDLSNVDAGEYTLVLRARWPGQPVLERRRAITVK